MVITITAIAAMALYLCTTSYYVWATVPAEKTAARKKAGILLAGGLAALLLHGMTALSLTFTPSGVNLSLWPMSVLILLVVNALVLASNLSRPLYSLLILLYPATALVLALTLAFDNASHSAQHLSLTIGLHVVLSVLAYSLMTIAALQSLMLAYQHRQLKLHHPGSFLLGGIPPLQTMERLLFQVIWTGFILLTLSLITGFLFLEDIWAQHLAHKSFFSIVAWVLFSVLLWGRHRLGWRGNTAMRWTLGGFICLALAYWGSKFVLEVLLELQ